MKISWKTLAVLGMAMLLLSGAGAAVTFISKGQQSAYETSVLGLEGEIATGREIFNANCSTCHGTEANGWIGPNLHAIKGRKSDLAIVRQVTTGQTPPMPKFDLDERQMADLLSYLKSI